MKRRIGKIIGLIVVTVFAIAVMYVSGGFTRFTQPAEGPKVQDKTITQDTSLAPVLVKKLRKEPIEILDTYAGTIEPFEKYRVGFQLSGQVQTLGRTESGKRLDVGDRVKKGQILAEMDRRILISRRDEAAANLENAQTEYKRLSTLQERSPGAVTQTAFQQAVRTLNVSKAMLDINDKNLEDAQLVSPADGVISRKMVNEGESVDRQQTIFEVVQIDGVLLTVGVPESRILPIQKRFNATRVPHQETSTPAPTSNFPVYIRRFDVSSNTDSDAVVDGTVYRISETANEENGLFQVQVLINNPDRLLKPGLVGKAEFVIEQLDGYRIPVESVVFGEGHANLFFATISESEPSIAVEFVDMTIANVPNHVATTYPLELYIEQGRHFILRSLPDHLELLVVKGQHRLVEGRSLELIGPLESQNTTTIAPVQAENATAALKSTRSTN